MNKYLRFLFPILLIFSSYIIYECLERIEFFKNVEEINLENKKCHKITYKNPIEDFVVIDNHYIIGSSFDVPFLFHKLSYLDNPDLPNDNMILFNIDNGEFKEIQIINFPKDISFHPHGIDLFHNKYIYIINHAFNYKKSFERIEIVEIIKDNNEFKELKYIKSIVLPSNFFGTLNSVAAVSNDTFYFTTANPWHMPIGEEENHYFNILRYKYGIAITTIFNLKLTGMFQYHKGEIKLIKESKGIINNGIIYDEENKLIYMAHTIPKQFSIYDTKNDTNPKLIKIIENEYAFDNFFMNKTSGIIYAGIIGKLYDFSKITDNFRKYGKWGNIDIYGGFQTIDTRNNLSIKIKHLSKNLLRGISSGIEIGKKQIMTASLEGGILICEEE